VVTTVALDLDLAMGAPGSDIDDGFALALALADPEIDVALVTTVNGNTDVATATTLTLELLRQLDAEHLPVHRGAARALLHPAERFGMVPLGIPARSPRPGHAVQAMTDLVRARPGEVTLVALGPLTNVALAMTLDPDFAGALGGLVIMGGVFAGSTGARGMPGEFNVWSDPEAARIVLQSGVVARWVGLDVTRQVRLTRAEAQAMAEDPHPFTAFAGLYSRSWIDHLAATSEPGTDSCALHDALAVAAVTRPDLLDFVDVHLEVQLDGVTRGVMVADRLDANVNAHVALGVDPVGFREHLNASLRRPRLAGQWMTAS
jgi:inosine-uridine nucleoside N-ribohydrolase